jgi:5-methylcytosine-specific restriction endonuclease McrA
MILDRNVLVLNQNYEPLSVTNAKRAVILVFLGKAEIVERDGIQVRSCYKVYPLPSVVRLFFYVKPPTREISLTRKNIIKRDGHTCQYCGARIGAMTTDHVLPRTRGGKDTWENLVCACVACNNRKGDRTLSEAGMKLFRRPRRPFYFHFIQNHLSEDARWKPYLFQG